MTNKRRSLKPGVSVATVTLFDAETEDIDVVAMQFHVLRLAKAGINSVTIAGSNGEGAHLTYKERTLLISAIREVLDGSGFRELPTIVNCSAQSVREVVDLCRQADQAGADYALILPPSYFSGAYTRQCLSNFFTDVASESPIPVILYNYPPVVGGTDLDSDLIIDLSSHPNIVGCKFTCANLGKINRVATKVDATTSKHNGSGFYAMAGLADCIVPTLAAGGTGVIVGLGNVLPKSCVKVFDLYEAGKFDEAQKLQRLLSAADWTLVAGGVTSVKSVLESYFNYGGQPRRPLPRAEKDAKERWAIALKAAVEYENGIQV
ncbi:uncharacterized protein Z519_08607 [Cladophialophora bantiana CBS 173.52]|uniref:Dihydrodipicolinate synthase n=1 Tax=Cladophialophora bantiana (strain ATCC 10958 / CBS 173.52 / CDC B-1940 / NIH 8579) TaxID=1442370 RepID=A0A0D2I1P1_CLAB1|nr:uncharacterized protein Z519_08607 [Cladophialophora bantiana CBS 173.52]KIW90824.1 hypothetical protein Z519_08607 [Cladophialophora bantiana CBS 173.52]